MKKLAVQTFTFIVIYLLSISPTVSSAQVIAGSVPPGTSISYPNLLMLSSSAIHDSDSLDIDCDTTKEIAFDLFKMLIVDGSNYLFMYTLNASVEIWADTGLYSRTLPLYNAGDTLGIGPHQWKTDTFYRVACAHNFCWTGYHQETDKYFAYRKISTQEIGWIKISFDLINDTITASVNEILVLCPGTGIGDLVKESIFNISPNPFTNYLTLHFPSPQNSPAHLKIFNSIGEVVLEEEIKLQDETLKLAALPQGIYLVRVRSESGVFTQKILK